MASVIVSEPLQVLEWSAFHKVLSVAQAQAGFNCSLSPRDNGRPHLRCFVRDGLSTSMTKTKLQPIVVPPALEADKSSVL